MRFRDYIRDRLWFYVIAAVSFGLMLLFLTAYRVSSQLRAFIAVIFLLFIITEELVGFLRKRRFYDELIQKLDILDKKYLIHEMVREPDFLEGRLTYEGIQGIP